MSEKQPSPPQFRVQTIELFFDLVFVFTITQVTHLVEHAHGAIDYLHGFSILMLVWWMYGGYIWLTNHAHAPKSMRLVLIAAMAGFLAMALAIPESNGAGRLPFGIAYLVVVLLHFLAFVWQGGAGAARAMLRIVPFNITAALLVISAGLIDGNWSWILLLAPVFLYLIVAVSNTGEGFALDSSHFVERHGLLLIIVLGEIVIAVGTGFNAPPRDLRSLLALILALAVIAALWWSYFDRDDARAEHKMLARDNRGRTRIALFGFNGAYLVMMGGLILVAAGLKASLGEMTVEETIDQGAAALHGNDILLLWGLALYLAGNGLFKIVLGLQPALPRLVAGLVFAAAAAYHPPLHGLLLVAVGLVLVVVTLAAESAASHSMS